MAAWCSEDDIRRIMPQLDAVLTSGSLSDSDLTGIIELATARVQSYCRRNYAEEFAGWGDDPPDELRDATAVIACCGVAQTCPAGVPYDVYCEGTRYTDTVQWLRDVMKGNIELPKDGLTTEEASPIRMSFNGGRPQFGPRGPR